jgi:hypothetical protein
MRYVTIPLHATRQPFLLQLAVHEVGASETFVSGLVYIWALGIAAGLTQLAASVSALASLMTIGLLLLAELRLAALLLPSSPAARTRTSQSLLANLVEG